MNKMKRFGAAALAVALLCGGTWILVREETLHNMKMMQIREYSPAEILDNPEDSIAETTTVTASVTTVREDGETVAAGAAVTTANTEESAPKPYLSAYKQRALTEQAAALADANPNAIGWLYVPDTPIDYPVMQSGDNDFYLTHTADNSYLKSGSIFLDYRYEPRFLNPTNIVYGHNMANGTMFGDIRNFKSQSYYEQHPYGWLVNGDAVYRIDFFSLAVVSAYDDLYDGSQPLGSWVQHLHDVSRFYDSIDIAEGDRLISLSTCASDFPDARAVLTGKLIPMNGGEDDA